jgi:hypothetical protein
MKNAVNWKSHPLPNVRLKKMIVFLRFDCDNRWKIGILRKYLKKCKENAMSLALLRCLATPVSTTFSDFPVLLVDEIGTLQIQEALYSLLDIFRMYLEFEGGVEVPL